MYNYIVCRFLKIETLGNKPYVYEVPKNLFDSVSIGYHYKIMNTDGYTYQGSFIEVVGKYTCSSEQKVEHDFLVNCSRAKFDSLPIKKLSRMEEAGKFPNADYLKDMVEPNETKSTIYPIRFHGEPCSSIREAYEKYKKTFTVGYSQEDLKKNSLYVEKPTASIPFSTDRITFNNAKVENFRIFGLDENEKEEKKTMNKIFGNVEFGKYTGREIKMSVNGLAYLADNGKYVAYDKNKLTLTDVTDFVFDMEGLLYLFPVAIKDIKIGDIIKHGNSYVIVKDIAGGNFLEVIEPCTNEVKTVMPLRNIFGFDFYTKVVSLMGEGAFGTIDESNPFGNMLPFFLMMGDKNTNGFDAKTFMLMTALNGGAMDFQNNPYLMMMMLDKEGDMGDILPLMMVANGGFKFGEKTCGCNCEKSKED